MAEQTTVAIANKRHPLRRLLRQPTALFSLIILVGLVSATAAAPLLTEAQPNAANPLAAFRAPDAEFPMGTDNLGRDMLARFLYGGQVSLLIGFAAAGIGAVIGVSIGLIAGYAGGWVDAVISWFIEVLMTFPGVLLALIVVAILGPGILNVMIAVGISFVPSFTRVTRAAALQVRELDYVAAARAFGSSDLNIIARHIAPNVIRPVLALVTLGTGSAILEAAALSFIGLGIQPPDPEWGAMLNAGRAFVGQAWWVTVFPGFGIFLTVLSINLLGDALSDVAAGVDL